MGGAVLVAAPAAAVGAGVVGVGTAAGLGGGASVAGMAGAGGLAGHFWRNIPKEKVREMGDLLDSGESGLIVVAVNKQATDVTPLLGRATKTIIDDTTKGDLDSLYDTAIPHRPRTGPAPIHLIARGHKMSEHVVEISRVARSLHSSTHSSSCPSSATRTWCTPGGQFAGSSAP